MPKMGKKKLPAITPIKSEKPVKSVKNYIPDMRNRYDDVTVKCEFCNEAFNTSRDYQDHANQQHPEQVLETWICCKQCDARLPSTTALTFHIVKVHSKAELRDSSGNEHSNGKLKYRA
jgi:hypothetical protein